MTVTVPVDEIAAVGENLTLNVIAWPGFSVTGNVAPDIEKPVPLIDAELIVNAAVPLDVSFTGSVALEPTVTSPKLRLVGLTVHWGVLEPVPIMFR